MMIRNNFWRMAMLFGLIWTIIWIFFKSMEHNGFTLDILLTSALQGLVMGIIWALSMKLLPSDPFKSIRLDLEPDESMIKEGGAFLMASQKGEGGKLALTDRRLIHKGSRYDTRKLQHSYDLEKIQNVRSVKSWLLLKNELQFDYDGVQLRFANDSPDQWVSTIERQMTSHESRHIEVG